MSVFFSFNGYSIVLGALQVGKSREEVLKSVMLEGYITMDVAKKTVFGVEVEITTYQGEHCDEYLVREVQSGRCSLFYKGILQFSWVENNGIRMGGFIAYEKGKALMSEDWNGLGGKEHRRIENCKKGLELVVKGNGVVYRGGLDNMESMRREGRGMEFDEESGRVLRCGVWKNDELFQIEKECESVEVMIEYAIEEGMENVSLLNRHPVYEGGYMFDEEKREVLRHGYGCKIDVNTGTAMREGKWERGKLKESVDLFDGWYVRIGGNDPFDWGLTATGELRVGIHNWSEWRNANKRVTELVIPSNCCNEEEWKVFDVSALKWLRSIEIGDDCFENTEKVKLIGLKELERVVIGDRCFTKHKNSSDDHKDPNRHFYLKNCEKVKELRIGCNSFFEYTVCGIENVDSLEVIEMKEGSGWDWSFWAASLKLKGGLCVAEMINRLTQIENTSL